jgi:uncharacterized protein
MSSRAGLTSQPDPLTSRPTGPPRIVALDVLRGVAILGTLGTNIWAFSAAFGIEDFLSTDARDVLARLLAQIPNGKFLGLLTLMFGMGLEIQRRSAGRAGRRWPGRYPWRAGLLFLDGVVHYLLVVELDVLMGYAVTGLVVAYLLATSERSQRVWMVTAAAVHALLLTAATTFVIRSPEALTGGADGPSNVYAEGSWWDLVVYRTDNFAAFRIEVVFIQAMSIAAFLLGARLLRAGVLEPRGTRLRRRLLLLGGLLLPVDLLLGTMGGAPGLLVARYGTAPLVALGLLALVVEVVQRQRRQGFISRRLTEVGRTALSSYVLQNVVASALCYGWGLGLAARMGADVRTAGTVGLYLLVAAAVMTFAHLWLRRFERGPVEWLWNAAYRAIPGKD